MTDYSTPKIVELKRQQQRIISDLQKHDVKQQLSNLERTRSIAEKRGDTASVQNTTRIINEIKTEQSVPVSSSTREVSVLSQGGQEYVGKLTSLPTSQEQVFIGAREVSPQEQQQRIAESSKLRSQYNLRPKSMGSMSFAEWKERKEQGSKAPISRITSQDYYTMKYGSKSEKLGIVTRPVRQTPEQNIYGTLGFKVDYEPVTPVTKPSPIPNQSMISAAYPSDVGMKGWAEMQLGKAEYEGRMDIIKSQREKGGEGIGRRSLSLYTDTKDFLKVGAQQFVWTSSNIWEGIKENPGLYKTKSKTLARATAATSMLSNPLLYSTVYKATYDPNASSFELGAAGKVALGAGLGAAAATGVGASFMPVVSAAAAPIVWQTTGSIQKEQLRGGTGTETITELAAEGSLYALGYEMGLPKNVEAVAAQKSTRTAQMKPQSLESETVSQFEVRVGNRKYDIAVDSQSKFSPRVTKEGDFVFTDTYKVQDISGGVPVQRKSVGLAKITDTGSTLEGFSYKGNKVLSTFESETMLISTEPHSLKTFIESKPITGKGGMVGAFTETESIPNLFTQKPFRPSITKTEMGGIPHGELRTYSGGGLYGDIETAGIQKYVVENYAPPEPRVKAKGTGEYSSFEYLRNKQTPSLKTTEIPQSTGQISVLEKPPTPSQSYKSQLRSLSSKTQAVQATDMALSLYETEMFQLGVKIPLVTSILSGTKQVQGNQAQTKQQPSIKYSPMLRQEFKMTPVTQIQPSQGLTSSSILKLSSVPRLEPSTRLQSINRLESVSRVQPSQRVSPIQQVTPKLQPETKLQKVTSVLTPVPIPEPIVPPPELGGDLPSLWFGKGKKSRSGSGRKVKTQYRPSLVGITQNVTVPYKSTKGQLTGLEVRGIPTTAKSKKKRSGTKTVKIKIVTK